MSTEPFPIINVRHDAAHSREPMGSKPKFWFYDSELGQCLYKESRPGTGEDWAEKMAAELAELLGLPHARVELAVWDGKRGTVSPSFVTELFQSLIHGNEVLMRILPGYPNQGETQKFYRVSQHTVSNVFDTLQKSRRQSL